MVNQAVADISGYCVDGTLDKKPKILSSVRHNPAFFEIFWQKFAFG
jgi:hypothetical protein